MKILAVGAHPDDVEFGCAPVLMLESQAGHEVKIVVASKGEASSSGRPQEREEESRKAAVLIGASSIDFVDLGGDCHISYSPATSLCFAREIRMFRPQIVLAPLTDENQHPDHISVGKAVRDGTRLARYGGLTELREWAPHRIQSLYYYSITQSFLNQPDVLVDVSPLQERWLAAMACHGSQMKTRNYDSLVISRAKTAGAAMGAELAVPLWANDPMCASSVGALPPGARHF